MENGSQPVPGATLSPPTVKEMQEIIDILKDPTPDQWGEGWVSGMQIIRQWQEQDPDLTEAKARSRLKSEKNSERLEKMSFRRRTYYRVADNGVGKR